MTGSTDRPIASRPRRRLVAVVVAAVTFAAALAAVGAGPATADRAGERRYIVRFAAPTPPLIDAATLASAADVDVVTRIPQLNTAVVDATADEAARIGAVAGVASVEADARVQLQATPNDPLYSQSGGLLDLQLPAAWDIHPGSGGFTPGGPFTGVPVAVIDSGIDPGHEEFQPFADKVPVCRSYGPNPIFNPVNCFNGAFDAQSHGTHVAGIVTAATDNGLGVSGVAPDSPLLVYKVCQVTDCWAADVATAIVDATDDGAKVINLSLGGPEPLTIWTNAVRYAVARDVVILGAAGNNGTTSALYPGALDGVLSIGALFTGTTIRASFSQHNQFVDLAGPGTNIWSSVAPPANSGQPNGYKRLSGTSMATAYVSGIAALIRSAHPDWTADRVRGALLSTAVDAGPPGNDFETGRGRPHAAAAIGWSPPQDGDLDDDGVGDAVDAMPYDPQQWPQPAVNLSASVGKVRFTLLQLALPGLPVRRLLFVAGGGNLLIDTSVGPILGTGLDAGTIEDTGWYAGVDGVGNRRYGLLVSKDAAGVVSVRLVVRSTTVVNGPTTAGSASVATP